MIIMLCLVKFQPYRHNCKKAVAAEEAAIDYGADLGYGGVPMLDYGMVVLGYAEVLGQDLFLRLPVGYTLN